ncbi:putative phage-related integrase [Sulfitobacter guttiformis KCTC 32187]|uniref:Site-specific recombinase XerD n=1 Tax=Sulfitobacter guttiformis TaxID=74349 RepID=A0A420DH80_9RHOB|nr:site-specific integrase [Sulfitobacter guttiformis]KIN72689.1 putative phage-related integrase [Sulfitobacter guttiformis KCTC 32187]RKE93584.1 site-specific recombinase XerD [Sulfitobacter guttiformis]
MAKVSEKFIERLRPTVARQEIPVEGSAGLYLIVQPSGAMGWAVRYRFDGRPRKMVIGKYPRVSIPDARARAAEVMAEVARGMDVAAVRLEETSPSPAFVTVRMVFGEYGKRKLDHMKSGAVTRREMDRHVVAPWGDRDIKTITRRDVIHLIDEIAEGGKIPTANRTRAYLSAMMGWAADREYIDANPAARMKAYGKEHARDRVMTDDELRSFMTACGKIKGVWGDLGMVLLLTGQRLNEIARMTTDEVMGQTLHLPTDRTKNGRAHDVPLSAPVISILEKRKDLIPENETPGYYFRSAAGTPVSGFSTARMAIDGLMGRDIPRWTFHDLRRTVATRMEGMGIPISVTEAVLNHVSGSKSGIVGIYQRHKYVTEKRDALDRWADELERIRDA